MPKDDSQEITVLLGNLAGGSPDVFGHLVEAVYEDLRGMAAGQLRPRFGARLNAMTITPTVLANDTAMALLQQRSEWQNSDQFFAIATRLMTRLITDYQRARLAAKRGGGNRGASLDGSEADPDHGTDEDDSGTVLRAIEKLHEQYPRKAEVVTLHFVGQHPLPRVAQILELSLPTVERDWRFARAWLQAELSSQDEPA